MPIPSPYESMFELTRGETVESIHAGAVAVVDAGGQLVAWYGNPEGITFLRSSAKPFQALPFVERGGPAFFDLTQQELALMCASHSGMDEHVQVARSIQLKAGVSESELLCGVHPPFHEPTAEQLRERKELPTPSRHNCSGKHSGMLAFARMQKLPVEDYINFSHPIQLEILQTFSDLCGIAVGDVHLGVDGCSAPNFAVPLRNAALGFARLCDPDGGFLSPRRAIACRTITSAMTAYPEMIAGPGEFDTRLIEVGRGRWIAKGGAEGYQAVGLMPGVLRPGSPAVGIALKIGDGDWRKKARYAVILEILRQLGALTDNDLDQLADFGPRIKVLNWRKLEVGVGRPRFQLQVKG